VFSELKLIFFKLSRCGRVNDIKFNIFLNANVYLNFDRKHIFIEINLLLLILSKFIYISREQ